MLIYLCRLTTDQWQRTNACSPAGEWVCLSNGEGFAFGETPEAAGEIALSGLYYDTQPRQLWIAQRCKIDGTGYIRFWHSDDVFERADDPELYDELRELAEQARRAAQEYSRMALECDQRRESAEAERLWRVADELDLAAQDYFRRAFLN